MDSVQSIDFAVIRLLNAYAARSVVFDTFVFDIADSSLLQGGAFMAAFWWCWFGPLPDREQRRREIVIAFIGGLLAVLISRLLQLSLPFHQRPLHTPELGFIVPFGVNPLSLSYWNSFPSDHAVLFFAFSTAIAYQSRVLGFVAGLWSLAVVCLPRLYLGYHYPSDIVVGAVIGIALMMLCHRVLSGTRLIDRLLRLETAHTTTFYVIAFLSTFELGVMFYDVRHLGRDAVAMIKLDGGQDGAMAATVLPSSSGGADDPRGCPTKTIGSVESVSPQTAVLPLPVLPVPVLPVQ